MNDYRRKRSYNRRRVTRKNYNKRVYNKRIYNKRKNNMRKLKNIFVAIFVMFIFILSSKVILPKNIPSFKPIESSAKNNNNINKKDENKENNKKDDINVNEWSIILVNEKNTLPSDFDIEIQTLPNGMEFDKRASQQLLNMINDGNDQGLSLMICSAYRSVSRQEEIFNNEISQHESNGMTYEQAYEKAKSAVAIPGTSEHNLGLAADICATYHQTLDEAYADTAEGKWLKANAHNYGFILRYPKDKQDITGIIFEPWHYRYVGVEHAKRIKELNLCLEEYIDYINN